MNRGRIATFAAAAALLASGALAASSSAAFHLIKISEVHEGSGGGTGDYIELQMFDPGQNLVGGHYLRTYDGGSTPFETFQITANVANGESQRTVLIANDASTPGADFVAGGDDLNVVNTNGGVCYLENLLGTAIDCVAWGSPVGTLPSPSGTPLALPGGTLGPNQSISRKFTAGCATALEASDDTDSSTADFALTTPSPRNNSTAPTETLCAPPKATPKKCKKAKKKKAKKGASAAAKKCKKKKKKK